MESLHIGIHVLPWILACPAKINLSEIFFSIEEFGVEERDKVLIVMQ